jgi:MoaA/NifB/PqqE/SkfB family radical SAM enzyme
MRTAILYIAERCNQSCVFCLEEDGSWAPFVDPTTLDVERQLEVLRDRGARHLTFMGGETFFRKDLGRILGHAKGLGYTRVGVTTNGTVLAKEGFLRELVRAGLDFIEISIHGHTPELANAIGGTHFTFERQRRALAEIEEMGLTTIVNVVICRENKDHLVDIARYVVESFPGIPARFKWKFVSLQGLAAERSGKGEDKALDYAEVDAVAVGDYLEGRGVPFWFYNLPLCRLGRHAHRAHEVSTLAADEQYFDYDHRGTEGYTDSGHQLEGRIWPTGSCGGCSLRPICPGMEASHARCLGTGALAARHDDPEPLVAFGLADRGLDPAGAAARLAALRREPRPATFLPARPAGAIRFRCAAEPEPLDVSIEPREKTQAALAFSRRHALSYRSWSEGDASERPRVRRLLARAVLALRRADTGDASLDAIRRAVAGAAGDGWEVEGTAAPPRVPSGAATPAARPPGDGSRRSLPLLAFRKDEPAQ